MIRQFDFEKMPVVEIVNEIMVDATKRGASDIHFDPLDENMRIRIRIDGVLHNYATVPNSIKKNLITRIKIISGMNITESRLPQDGAIKATLQDTNLDLRVSCIPTNNGEKIVIRILDYSMSLAGVENLGFSDDNYKKVLEMISKPNGIILVTGATGTGKSTTVYSILQKLNTEATNIVTVEDPVEMNIEGINQIQTNSEIGLTFATALRSILRQDPNIIMVGEIRDTETAKIAVRASITGHLVLSTVHTNNSLNTIERLLDMEVERYLLASSLEGIISQVLARKLCPHCRTLRKTNEYEKELFKSVLNKDVEEIYTTEGCEQCGNGYSGRIAIHEVLLFNQDIRDAISAGVRRDKLRELVYQSDVNTLLEDGLEKVLMGLTTVEEVIKLIELEDDENGSKAYGLKSALSNTAITKENHKTFEDVLEEKNEIDNLVNSDSKTVKVNDIDSELKNNNSENSSADLKIEYEVPNQNNTINYEVPSQNNTVKHEVPNQNNTVKHEVPSQNNTISYEIPSQNNTISYEVPNQNNTITYQEPTINYQQPNSQEQPAMPQTLNDLINKANKG